MAQLVERCPVCGTAAGAPFAELQAVPVFCNVLWATREAAEAAPRGDIRLVFCDACGMTWNSAFDPGLVEYAPAYENSLHFSRVFREYAAELAARLVERYDVRGKHVVDIGSGKGEFLSLVCELGGNRGVGFDPSYDGDEVVEAGAGEVRFVRDLYSEAHAHVPADLVCCRHVLEHVPEPARLLEVVRRALDGQRGAVLYFEVPAAEFVLGDLSVWDVIYEHCSLFSAPALRRLFEEAGFEVLDSGLSFGGQYLWIEARPAARVPAAPPAGDEVEAVRMLAARFEERLRATLDRSRARLAELTARGGPLAVWGAGSKGVTFLNLAAPARNGGSLLVVDVNPRKQGKHVAGRGDRVLAPDELRTAGPTGVLVMNPLYRDEIDQALKTMGVDAEVMVV
jgi:SAM-dependent methyltransferase